MKAKMVVRGARWARKLLRRCFIAALNAIAYLVGAVAVSVFYPLVALGAVVKETEKDGVGWMFRVLFGGILIIAAIGAIVTIWVFVRR